MPKLNPIAYQWFQQALELKTDEEIFVPVSSKVEQKTLYKDIRKVIREYSVVDKIQASKIDAVGVFKDGRAWVKLYVKETSPLVGFKQGKDGKTERIILVDPAERLRQINMMLSDKIPKEKIIETLKLSSLEQEQAFGAEDG